MYQACPVNLVTRIKYEAKEPSPLTTHTSISSSSSLLFPISSPSSTTSTSLLHDLHNCFRRRKRGRYSHTSSFNFSLLPPPCSASSSPKKPLLSDYTSGSMIYHQKPGSISSSSSSSISSSFACPNCKLHFSNRDSLAMHMMESVRLEGCCHSLSTPSTTLPTSTQSSQHPKPTSISSTPPTTSTSIKTSVSSSSFPKSIFSPTAPQPTLFCKICHDPFLTLDSLAMHMFLHINNNSSSHLSEPITQPPAPFKYSSTSPNYLKSLIDATLLENTVFSNNNNNNNTADHNHNSSSTESLRIDTKVNSRTINHKTVEDNSTTPNTDSKLYSTSPHTIKPAVAKPKLTSYPERNCFSAPSIEEKRDQNHELDTDSKSCQKLTVRLPSKDGALTNNSGESNTKDDVVQSSSLGMDNEEDGELEILGKLNKCIHCRILFEDPTVYCLHMGLHNVNDPWQCNMCGRKCEDLYDFTVHSLHF